MCKDGRWKIEDYITQLVLFFVILNPDIIHNEEILALIEEVFNNKKENMSPPFPTDGHNLL